MAQSMFKQTRVKDAKKTWRTVLIGAAVPIAMFAPASAVSAAEIDQAQTVNSEQLPPAPAPVPDPTALLDLQQCLTDLQAALPATPPAPAPAEAEQLPPAPAPTVPDVAALTKLCQDILANVTGAAPTPPTDAPPVTLPGRIE